MTLIMLINAGLILYIGGWTLYVAEPGYRQGSAGTIVGILTFLSVFWWAFVLLLRSAVP